VLVVTAIAVPRVIAAHRRAHGKSGGAFGEAGNRLLRPLTALSASLASSSRWPLVGHIRVQIDLVVATRIMATMLAGGAAESDGLQVVSRGVVTQRVRTCFEAAHVALRAGDVIAMLNEFRGLLAPTEMEMLAVGHERGLSVVQWQRIAVRRRLALDELLRRLVSLTEPLLVVAVGLIVGAAVSALYLPTFRILDAL